MAGPVAKRSGGTAVRAKSATPKSTRGYASGVDDYLARLSKIEGQVRGLQRMIEEDRWCPLVITQISAVNRALEEVAVGLLSDHLRHCVLDAARKSIPEADQALVEVVHTIRQVVRL